MQLLSDLRAEEVSISRLQLHSRERMLGVFAWWSWWWLTGKTEIVRVEFDIVFYKGNVFVVLFRMRLIQELEIAFVLGNMIPLRWPGLNCFVFPDQPWCVPSSPASRYLLGHVLQIGS